MSFFNDYIYENITHDMSSGLVMLDFRGYVRYMNPSAEQILGKSFPELSELPFVQFFFAHEENDRFVQLILDAVYEKNSMQEGVVTFVNDEKEVVMRLKTSYLYNDGKCTGIICMMDDISELYELKDAVRAMNEIKRLNESLTLRNTLLKKTFGRFLSDDIVKELLDTEGGLSLGGKKLNVSIMMSDLRGFTALSERMDAYDLIRMLNHYLGVMTGIIQKRKGTIIEFIGDGIMVLFGAPSVQKNHADNAVIAACEMQDAMEEINNFNRENGYPELEMGIGLHTGEAIIGNIGSEQRTKYGAVGNNINLCGRIESFTTGGEILISESTYRALSVPVSVAREQEILPKGAKKPLRLYMIDGVEGPVSLSLKGKNEKKPLRKTRNPVEIAFVRLQGKMKDGTEYEGKIKAVSMKEMIMETSAELPLYENICIDLCGDLYLKVTGYDGGNYRLRITSFSGEFEKWVTENT